MGPARYRLLANILSFKPGLNTTGMLTDLCKPNSTSITHIIPIHPFLFTLFIIVVVCEALVKPLNYICFHRSWNLVALTTTYIRLKMRYIPSTTMVPKVGGTATMGAVERSGWAVSQKGGKRGVVGGDRVALGAVKNKLLFFYKM